MEFKYFTATTLQTTNYIGSSIKQTFDLKRPGQRPHPSKIFDTLLPAYPEGKVPINQHKIKAVRDLLKYIPEEDEKTKKYYKDYLIWPTSNVEENE